MIKKKKKKGGKEEKMPSAWNIFTWQIDVWLEHQFITPEHAEKEIKYSRWLQGAPLCQHGVRRAAVPVPALLQLEQSRPFPIYQFVCTPRAPDTRQSNAAAPRHELPTQLLWGRSKGSCEPT